MVLSGCDSGKKGTVTGTKYYKPSETGSTQQTEVQKEESTEKVEAVFDADVYIVLDNDMELERLTVRQFASGRRFLYSYSLTTSFIDKYGNTAPVTEFYPGRVITLGGKDSKGKLKKAQISDEVWEYADVVRYEIDEERQVFQIADTKYTYDDDLLVLSDEKTIKLSEVGPTDELRIIGKNREILSVAVTTGQGQLSVQNTELFEGSFIQVGKRIFAKITKDLILNVPEGTYVVAVANKGYGGSKEVTIERGKITKLDLDELKGEGPKKGIISFEVVDEDGNPLDAEVKIDGEIIEDQKACELIYGMHPIKVSVDQYEGFSKKLFVNSKEATITITLKRAGTQKEEEQTIATESSEKKSEADTTENDREKEEENMVSDYLSTITELLGNLYN